MMNYLQLYIFGFILLGGLMMSLLKFHSQDEDSEEDVGGGSGTAGGPRDE